MKKIQPNSMPLTGSIALVLFASIYGCQTEPDAATSKARSGSGTIAASAESAVLSTKQTGGGKTDEIVPVVEVSEITATTETTETTEPRPAVVETVVSAPGVIDLAICLDTSGSMSGLIDSTKQTLWSIVNDMALIEPAPVLRVALLTFGNDGHSKENGWVHIDSGFTSDLDAISEKLFALTTHGGSEYVGRAVHLATRNLDWSTDAKALKLIVVAGNESANQDPTIQYRDASKEAITAGIMVNSIYCGNPMDRLADAWREVSQLADGHFSSIDKDNGMVVIDTPFDEELQRLTTSVNTTYVPWGDQGSSRWAAQTAQDVSNGALNQEAMASRAKAKNSALYVCSWDLVDATRTGQVKLADVDRAKLAPELQALNDEELQKHVDAQAAERKKIQSQVAEVSKKRSEWLVQERARLNTDDSKALDRVMRDAIRTQAVGKGFQYTQEK